MIKEHEGLHLAFVVAGSGVTVLELRWLHMEGVVGFIFLLQS